MLFGALLFAAAVSEQACDATSEDEVCLLQFMTKKNHEHDYHSQLASLVKEGNPDSEHEHEHCPECPGSEFTAKADSGICSHGGAEIAVMFDKEDIQNFFGDNVMMSHWRYFLETTPTHGTCKTGCELINPDVHHHQYHVGITQVRVDGYDLAGNSKSCHRTINILDEQAPVFAERPDDLDTIVTIKFQPGKCDVDAGVPFKTYEDMGFVAAASDNCDKDVEIVKTIYTSGVESVGANLTGPGTHTLEYKAIDDHSNGLFGEQKLNHTTTTHTVQLNLVDGEPPYGFTDCPDSQVIEIEAHETSSIADWIPPIATGDNCDELFDLPPAEEQHHPPRYPGDSFDIGTHPVTYAFKDAAGNYMEEMCTFTIKVVPKAHPVVVTCPSSTEVPVEKHADFGIVQWSEPIVMQHDKQLSGPGHITYQHGVESGMPFPFGVTTVTVHAKGEITGNRTREHEQEDECTFNITVSDPYDPKVNGTMYRCQHESPGAAPYAICGGKDVLVNLFKTYMDTHGYEIAGTEEKNTTCCTSEANVVHKCTQVSSAGTTSPARYCTPAN